MKCSTELKSRSPSVNFWNYPVVYPSIYPAQSPNYNAGEIPTRCCSQTKIIPSCNLLFQVACRSYPCKNNGTCQSGFTEKAGYRCLCPTGWMGTNCEDGKKTWLTHSPAVLLNKPIVTNLYPFLNVDLKMTPQIIVRSVSTCLGKNFCSILKQRLLEHVTFFINLKLAFQ